MTNLIPLPSGSFHSKVHITSAVSCGCSTVLNKTHHSQVTPRVTKEVTRSPSCPTPRTDSYIGHFAVPIMINRFQVLSDQTILDASLRPHVENNIVDTIFDNDHTFETKSDSSLKYLKNHYLQNDKPSHSINVIQNPLPMVHSNISLNVFVVVGHTTCEQPFDNKQSKYSS